MALKEGGIPEARPISRRAIDKLFITVCDNSSPFLKCLCLTRRSHVENQSLY